MQQHYQPLYEQVRDLQFKFHDVLDKPDHPMAHLIRNELHQLEGDIRADKHPRSIENRVESIQRQIREVQYQNHGIMSPEHSQYFHSNFDHMRQNIRRFPHY